MHLLVGFARFWYDFIVGDSVALAIGAPAALVVGFLLVRSGAGGPAQILLPLVVVTTLAISLRVGAA